MAQNLTLEIVTPEKTLLETEADYVTLPGIIGELGILPGHIPIVTGLQSGVLVYKNGNSEKKLAIHYGFAEISQDKISVLANTAELGEEINVDRSKASQVKTEEELKEIIFDVDNLERVELLQQKLSKTTTRLIAAE
jgi:F-type H+-transporting ATPase subunit epsilon